MLVFMYLKRNYVNGNILQCIARYNYKFMKLKPSSVGLMDQKKLIDILTSVMFLRPGSVSIFTSIYSLVFFLFIQVDLSRVSATEFLELVFVLFCRSNVKTMRYITDGVDGRVGVVKYVRVTRSRDVFAIICFLRQKFCPHFFRSKKTRQDMSLLFSFG